MITMDIALHSPRVAPVTQQETPLGDPETLAAFGLPPIQNHKYMTLDAAVVEGRQKGGIKALSNPGVG